LVHYSIDTNEREWYYGVFAFLSSLIAFFINNFIANTWIPQIITLSIMTVFLGLVKFFDSYLWNLSTRVGLSKIPNLNGKWKGKITKEDHSELETEMEISQTWTKIQAKTTLDDFIGELDTASFLISNKTYQRIRWTYKTKTRFSPNPKKAKKWSLFNWFSRGAKNQQQNVNSEGVNELSIIKDGEQLILEGYYYSRQSNGGKIFLSKIS
jgi:hypothetical protein